MSRLLLRISVLCISLLTVMASAAISPALAKIRQAFAGVDITLVKLVLTLPSLVIIPFSLLSGWLASRMKKKNLLIIGLIIYLLGGVGGAFARTITQLLIIRGIFGIGVGLIIPLSTSLIADFFAGEERANMMGLSGSVSHLGGVVFLLVSGWLACLGWRYSFAVYGLAVVIMLMIIFWLPEPENKKAPGLTKSKLPGSVYLCAVLGALMMVAFYAAPTNLAMFIESEREMYTSKTPLFKDKEELQRNLEKGTISQVTLTSFKDNGISLSNKAALSVKESGKVWAIADRKHNYIVKKEDNKLVIYSESIGRPGIAGYLLSAMTFIGIIAGAVMARLMRIFRSFCAAVAIGAMAVGYAVLGSTTSLSGVLVSMVCIGFSSGVLMPLLLLEVARIASSESRVLAMAVVSGGIYLGQFLSPVVLKGVSVIFGGEAFRTQFNFLAFGLGIATAVGIIMGVKNFKKNGSAAAAMAGHKFTH